MCVHICVYTTEETNGQFMTIYIGTQIILSYEWMNNSNHF